MVRFKKVANDNNDYSLGDFNDMYGKGKKLVNKQPGFLDDLVHVPMIGISNLYINCLRVLKWFTNSSYFSDELNIEDFTNKGNSLFEYYDSACNRAESLNVSLDDTLIQDDFLNLLTDFNDALEPIFHYVQGHVNMPVVDAGDHERLKYMYGCFYNLMDNITDLFMSCYDN